MILRTCIRKKEVNLLFLNFITQLKIFICMSLAL